MRCVEILRGVTVALVTLAGLAGCGEEAAETPPAPVALTRAHIGHYCRMIVADHKGPKGQIHVKGRAKPYFFSSVRDTIAFTLLPEESKRITAIYVNDMARASWDKPEPGTWIDARGATYVIGSSRRGGMGAAEAVPFGNPAAAKAFAEKYGGRVVAFAQIPKRYILGDASGETVGGAFTLTDQTGKTRSAADFRGKYLLVYFGYTSCPDICPTGLMTITDALTSMGPRGKAVQPLFITVDPERDTPDRLKLYHEEFHPRFVMLTGTPRQIAQAAGAYRVVYKKHAPRGGGAYTVDHSAFIFLMDRQGRYVARLPHQISAKALRAVLEREMSRLEASSE